MTKTFKKSLTLILSVLMLMSVMPMSLSLAAETPGLTYYYTGGGSNRVATVTDYTGSATEVEIPDTTTNGGNSYKVTTIGTSNNNNNYGKPFYNDVNITKVTLGNNVQTINSNAFRGCSNLETIVIPKSLTTVNSNAFNNCNKLTTVNYKGSPEDWAKITISTTGNSSLTSATINYYYGHNCSTEGHVTQKVNGTSATCVEAGEMEHWNCIICDADFSDQAATQALETTVIDAPGHSWSETLTQGEESHYIACTVTGCGATKEGTIEAHDWEDATCTTPKTCTVCQKTQGNANDHDWAEEWTITETEHYKECTVDGCGAIKEDTVGAHNKGVQGADYVYVAPTCQRSGFQGDILCVDCEAFIEIGKTLTQLDHTYVKDNEKSWEPTCDDNAENKEGYYYGVCSMCEDVKEEILPALEHNYEVWTESDLNPATCVSLGLEFSYCSGCRKFEERSTATFNSNKHTNLVFNEAQAPDCENDGNVAYWECEGCHKTYSDEAATELLTTVVEPKINHNYGDTWVYDEEAGKHKQTCANDATHINWGDCEDSETDTDCLCDICGHIVAHNFADATCTAPATCTVCRATTGTATGHAYGEYVYDAETGKHYAVCANDEEHIDSDFCMNTNPEDDCECDVCYRVMDHDFALANCIAPATCRVCGEEDGEINPENHIGHSIVETEEYREATCVSKEYTKNVTRCLGCGEVLETEEVEGELDPDYHLIKLDVPNGGKDKVHYEVCEREGCDYKVWVDHELSGRITDIPATCTKEGRIREYCSICKSYIYTPIAKTAHVDAKKDGKCDTCGTSVEVPADPTPETPTPENPAPEGPSETCPCNCHKSGIMGLFFKFILFFQKFFGINKMCDCGKAHY